MVFCVNDTVKAWRVERKRDGIESLGDINGRPKERRQYNADTANREMKCRFMTSLTGAKMSIIADLVFP